MATKKKPKRRLLKIEIDEVSLVSKPAVPTAIFLVRKRDDGGEDAELQMSRCIEFAKAEEHPDFTLVSGPVLVPEEVDSQGDVISAEAIEEAAHDYLVNANRVGLQHKRFLPRKKAETVESYIARADLRIGTTPVTKGTWIIAMRIYDPAIRKSLRDGKLTGFSIGGRGTGQTLKREAGDAEMTDKELVRQVKILEQTIATQEQELQRLQGEVRGPSLRDLAGDSRVQIATSELLESIGKISDRMSAVQRDLDRARGRVPR